jgi:hypothetical protein
MKLTYRSILLASFLIVCLTTLAQSNINFPKPNPFLANQILAITHVESAQTDSFPYTIPKGTFHIDLQKTPEVAGGPINIMTLTSTSPNYMWGVSSGGVSYIEKTSNSWHEVARAAIPGIPSFSGKFNKKALGSPFTSAEQIEKVVSEDYKITGLDRIANGVYSLVDKDNKLYVNYGNKIYVLGLKSPKNSAAGMQILHAVDFDSISKEDKPAGISMTYDGYLVLLGHHSISIVDRKNLNNVLAQVIFNKDEQITNSLAVDENNGIYVASNKLMHKLVWTGNKLSTEEADGAWTSPYNSGEQPPVVKIGTGTGSTPTLMGFGDDPDKLVVITDGANRMNLVAFWRDAIPKDFVQQPGTPSRRIAGQIPVTVGFKNLPKFIQSEQPVVVKGYGAFVVNNIGPKGHKDLLVGVMGLGPVFLPPHGVERFQWDTANHKWTSVWSNPNVVSTSMVPVVSIPSNIVLVNGYTRKRGWEITGLDWDTGEVVHRTIFGQDNYGNGAYALLELISNNNLVFNSIAGPFRIQYD